VIKWIFDLILSFSFKLIRDGPDKGIFLLPIMISKGM